MPWNNQGNDGGGPWGQGGGSGGNNGGGGPWGQGGGGGGGKPPQDIDELVQQGRDALRRVIPGGGSSGRSFILLLIIRVLIFKTKEQVV